MGAGDIDSEARPETRTRRRVALERRAAADLPYQAFVRDYVARNRPVVVENALQACAAAQRWTPQFFRERFAARRIQVSPSEQMTFADFIDDSLRWSA